MGMAKRRPTPTLAEMEKKLGYRVDSLNYPEDGVQRFYSDLRPVLTSPYERTKKDFEELKNQKEYEITSETILPDHGVPQKIAHGQDIVTFTRRTYVGLYSLAVDIHYGFGLHLPLLFSKNEAYRALAVPKLQPNTTSVLESMFFNKLPKELRDKIYLFALPIEEWSIGDVDSSNELDFAGGIGDLTGFYFPLSSLAMLRVNKQMRQEALPLAYRRTVFHLDDMDDLIRLLIAVGDIGRDNIESLELAWQSRTDFECQWDEDPVASEHSLTLPAFHVGKCVKLLKQCKRLRFLRLYFERDLVQHMSPNVYESDPGICELRSIHGIERVEIWDLGYEPLKKCGFVEWLKEAIEWPGGDKEDEKTVDVQSIVNEL